MEHGHSQTQTGIFRAKDGRQNITLEAIAGAVLEELTNVGENLGFRTMRKKLREVHHLNVKQEDALLVMHAIDP